MKKLKLFLTMLLVAVGVNTALANKVQTGRVLTAAEINQGGVEIILYLPYTGSNPNDRYFQTNDADDAFLTLNVSGNNTLATLSKKCVFVVEKVTDGIKLKHKATGKYVGNANNKPAPVEGADNAIVFTAIQNTIASIEYFGNATYSASNGVRFQRQNPTNYMNSNGPQWAGGTGCWSLYVPFEAEYVSVIAANYVYTIQPSTDLTKYLSTNEADEDGGFKTYTWSTTKEKFALLGTTDAWQLKSTLTDKYVGTGNGHGGVNWDCLDNPTTTWEFFAADEEEDIYKLHASGIDNGLFLGWQTYNGQSGFLFTNKDSNNTWKFTKVGSYVTVKYMNGTNEIGTAAQGGVDFGRTVEALAEANVPDGYYLTQGQTFATVREDGVFEYSVNVTELPACYTITYVDENDNALSVKTEVSSGLSVLTRGINRVSLDAVLSRFIGTKNFLIYDFVSATVDGTTYDSWDDLKAAVTESANVTVKLTTKVQLGKYYTFRHAGNMPEYRIFDTGEVLNADVYNKDNDRYVFTFEDAGEGRFYIRNAGTNRYVKRTGASGINNNENIPTLSSLDENNCRYYVTNAIQASRPDIYGIVDADAVANPVTGRSNERYLHTNGQYGEKAEVSHKVVRWSIVENPYNSQWYLDEVPVITLKFKIGDTVYEEGIAYNAPKGGANLPYGKVLSTFTGISFDNYSVEAYELKEQTYTNRTQFFQACHNLAEDATATIILREKNAGEVDVTVELWKAKGKGYANEDMSDATPKEGNDWTDNLKVWALSDGGTDIKGSTIPAGIDFKIVSSENTGVGGMISNTGGNHAHYHYGHVITNPWCICFQDVSAAHTGTTFTMSVADNYYILQYTLGGFPGNGSNLPTLSNLNGGTVTLGSPDSNARQYNLTDTPAANEAAFTVTSAAANSVAANYFRVRIVNEAYLLNSMDRGEMIVEDALYDSENVNAVGYPVATSAEYAGLKDAYDKFEAEGGRTLANYIKMLQAYSRYISCTDLNMPADCQVYTLAFKNSFGTKMLVNNGDEGLEIVPYTDDNKAQLSARWISHKNGEGKLVLVNKKDGKYLQATAEGVGVSETYDAETTSFGTRAITQDLTDYMASATDEKLLGAVCVKNAAETNKLTIRNNVFGTEAFAVKTAAYFDSEFSSAMLIENVDGGQTYNNVTFRRIGDEGKFYATYYGFYPVENPADAEMYYVKNVTETGYMELQPVQEDVIRPGFAVILMSDDELLYADDESGETTHLHIGEYTDAKKEHIDELLTENGANLLQGTLETKATSEATTVDGNRGQVYVLSGNANEGVGFYKYTAANLPKGKAYYVHPATTTGDTEIRGFHFTDQNGVETTIELNPAETSADAVIYDLSGRRVKSAANGLYIINGKKVIK